MLSRRLFSTAKSGRKAVVNGPYESNTGTLPVFKPQANAYTRPDLSKYNHSWSHAESFGAMKDHAIFSWGSTDPTCASTMLATKAENIYIYDHTGKRFMDWSSGAVCSNLGHTVPKEIIESVNDQLKNVAFVYGDLAYTEIRAKLTGLLGDVVPGDIDGFYLASGGAEAIEVAIRMARKYTNRPKIMSRYRSYHGSTSGALAATGDFRRWFVPPSAGFVQIMDPFPLNFTWGNNQQEAVERSLNALHDQIMLEDAGSIAAILLESITGAGGWLRPPVEYMQGVRALCDKYGILLICDEVMTGFGRTGKMFGFEHHDGVLPDMITFAKGLTAAFLPLSGVGVRKHVYDYYRQNPLGYGSTYCAHPVSCAVGYHTIRYLIENNVVEHVKKMEAVMIDELTKLMKAHPCVKQARAVGMGAGFDLAGPDGNFLLHLHEGHPQATALKKRLLERGLVTMVRGHHVHCTPPLITTEAQIREGFAIISDALVGLDEFVVAK